MLSGDAANQRPVFPRIDQWEAVSSGRNAVSWCLQLLPWYRGMLNQRAAPLSPCGLTETWHKYQHSENISFKSRNITKASLALTPRPTDAFLFRAEGFCGSEIFPQDPKLGCKSVYWCSKARLRYHHPRPRRGHLVVPFTAIILILAHKETENVFSCFLI